MLKLPLRIELIVIEIFSYLFLFFQALLSIGHLLSSLLCHVEFWYVVANILFEKFSQEFPLLISNVSS